MAESLTSIGSLPEAVQQNDTPLFSMEQGINGIPAGINTTPIVGNTTVPRLPEQSSFLPKLIAGLAAAKGQFGPAIQLMEQERKTDLYKQFQDSITQAYRYANGGEFDKATEVTNNLIAAIGDRAPELLQVLQPINAKISERQLAFDQASTLYKLAKLQVDKNLSEGKQDPRADTVEALGVILRGKDRSAFSSQMLEKIAQGLQVDTKINDQGVAKQTTSGSTQIAQQVVPILPGSTALSEFVRDRTVTLLKEQFGVNLSPEQIQQVRLGQIGTSEDRIAVEKAISQASSDSAELALAKNVVLPDTSNLLGQGYTNAQVALRRLQPGQQPQGLQRQSILTQPGGAMPSVAQKPSTVTTPAIRGANKPAISLSSISAAARIATYEATFKPEGKAIPKEQAQAYIKDLAASQASPQEYVAAVSAFRRVYGEQPQLFDRSGSDTEAQPTQPQVLPGQVSLPGQPIPAVATAPTLPPGPIQQSRDIELGKLRDQEQIKYEVQNNLPLSQVSPGSAAVDIENGEINYGVTRNQIAASNGRLVEKPKEDLPRIQKLFDVQYGLQNLVPYINDSGLPNIDSAISRATSYVDNEFNRRIGISPNLTARQIAQNIAGNAAELLVNPNDTAAKRFKELRSNLDGSGATKQGIVATLEELGKILNDQKRRYISVGSSNTQVTPPPVSVPTDVPKTGLGSPGSRIPGRQR
jgi:hypothetical protein